VVQEETRAESIEKGREVLEKEMKRLGITLGNREELARLFKYESVDDLYAAIGYGDLSAGQVTLKLAVQEEQPKITGELPRQPWRLLHQGIGIRRSADPVSEVLQPAAGRRDHRLHNPHHRRNRASERLLQRSP